MRIGVFGGTFDPPHLGHLVLTMEAADQLKLAKVLWVITPDPPHKLERNISPSRQRLEMVQAAIRSNPIFEISRVDLDRPGPHYAVDTLRLIAQQYPDVEIYYLIGGDSLRDLPLWHRPDELLRHCTALGVMHRLGVKIDMEQLERVLPGIGAKVIFIQSPLLDISSHEIRARVAAGRPYRYYLPFEVYQLIEKYHLYHQVI